MIVVKHDIDRRLAQLELLQQQQLLELKFAASQLVVQFQSVNTIIAAVDTLFEKREVPKKGMDAIIRTVINSAFKYFVNPKEQNQLQYAFSSLCKTALTKYLQFQWHHFNEKIPAQHE